MMNTEVLEEIRDSLKRIELLAKPAMVVDLSAQDVNELQEKLKQEIEPNQGMFLTPCSKKAVSATRDVYDIVHAINVLAMSNTDVIHIFVKFSGHTSSFHVYAHPADTVYTSEYERNWLIYEDVDLGDDNALEQLLSIESQLTELIIEAREEAAAKVGVEA
ncbi:hypothetical protein [Vibrio nigripulchritudo]|uniref:hypothetical protein n=1 Tax=Vibrio nigripulchritudo TaxID=28173 RepID=UPI00249112DF|nr:hypothetical protein [Vibrio nigripulchritudo]BDU38726.1 hypothetical protein TUMSATVNIG2_31950 [Vibrio nigripulchritudo]BDU44446.1 hypothetical protein TUMSATVNIG3_32440 [Vibrio nigripulchritudo]